MQLLSDNSTVAFHSLIDIFLSLIKNLSSFRGLGLVSDSVFGCVRDASTGKVLCMYLPKDCCDLLFAVV